LALALVPVAGWAVPFKFMPASFHSPAAFCATCAHEQIHSTGHESRLKRDLGGAFGKTRCAREELVAELGAV
jgi:antirestriction protein ArdC